MKKNLKLWSIVLSFMVIAAILVPVVVSANQTVQPAKPVQPNAIPINPVLTDGISAGSPTVIYDTTDNYFKMWYVQTSVNATTVNNFTTGISSVVLGSLITDLSSGNFTAVANDQTDVKNVLTHLAGLTTGDLATLTSSVQTKFRFSKSLNGTTWDPPVDVTLPTGAWDTYITSPNVVFDPYDEVHPYKMWYTGSTINTTDLHNVLADLNGLTTTQLHDLMNALATENLSAIQTAIASVPNKATILLDILAFAAAAEPSIGYAYSADGLTWTPNATAVLTTGTGWDNFGTATPSVIVNDDGSYDMWYTGILLGAHLADAASFTSLSNLETILHDNITVAIGHAHSTDGLTWTKDGSPVLQGGLIGAWDGAGVSAPSVVNVNGTMEMWYTGATVSLTPFKSFVARTMTLNNAILAGADSAIGHAVYSGGVWTPDVGAVLNRGISGSWDQNGIDSPSVVQYGNLLYMWYAGTKIDASGTIASILNNSLTLTGDQTAIGRAIFAKTGQFKIVVAPQAGGSVNVNPVQATYNAGDTITLTANPTTSYTFWKWTGNVNINNLTVNPLTFTIFTNMTVVAHFSYNGYYIPPTTTTGGGTPVTGTGTVDVGGVVTQTGTDAGTFNTSVTLTSTDGGASVQIGSGTVGTYTDPVTGEEKPLTSLSVQQLDLTSESIKHPPEGKDIIVCAYEFLPSPAHFNPPVTITLKFDPASIPPGGHPVVKFYNVSTGKWETIPGGIVSGDTITFQVDHWSTFAVMGAITETTTTQPVPTGTTTTTSVPPVQTTPGSTTTTTPPVVTTTPVTPPTSTSTMPTTPATTQGSPAWMWPVIIAVAAVLVILGVGFVIIRRRR